MLAVDSEMAASTTLINMVGTWEGSFLLPRGDVVGGYWLQADCIHSPQWHPVLQPNQRGPNGIGTHHCVMGVGVVTCLPLAPIAFARPESSGRTEDVIGRFDYFSGVGVA